MNKPNYFKSQNLVLRAGTDKKIEDCKILQFGCGAAGNETAMNFVLSGFRNLLFVDFDRVEDSNLSKSVLFTKEDVGRPKAQVVAERVAQLCLHEHPNIKYIDGNFMEDMGKGYFWDYDFVVICVDTKNGRGYGSDWCVRAGKPFIEVGFSNYQVNVSMFGPVGDTYPICLREYIGQGSFSGKRNSCSGLKVKDTDLKVIPVIQFTAAIAGAIVAMEVVKYLEGRSTLLNKTLYYFGLNHETLITGYDPDPECKIHQEAFVPVIPVHVPYNPTVQQVVEAVEKAVGHEVKIKLPDEFVFSGRCNGCGKELKINRRKSKMWNDDRWCEECRAKEDYEMLLDYDNQWESISSVSSSSSPDVLRMRLREVGVPQNDVLKVIVYKEDGKEEHYVRIMEPEPQGPLKIIPVETVPTIDLDDEASAVYGDEADASDVKALEEVKRIFTTDGFHAQEQHAPFTSYVNKKALDDFVDYADQLYQTNGYEATGVIVGYYCHSKKNPGHMMAVATTFLPAAGRCTRTTCEISEEDSIRILKYCEEHKMLPLVWIHSHPGFGAFYSGTDNHTLLNKYSGPHQMGIVIDNLKNTTKAFKAKNGVVNEINYFIYETDGKRCKVWDKSSIKNKPIFKRRLK